LSLMGISGSAGIAFTASFTEQVQIACLTPGNFSCVQCVQEGWKTRS
jgi:hypothetical protein